MQGRKTELKLSENRLAAVQTVRDLSSVLSETLRSDEQIKHNLQWSDDDVVLINGTSQELCRDSKWAHATYPTSSDRPLLIARKFEIQNSLGGICSKTCHAIFALPSFYSSENRRSRTLMSYLNLQESKKRKRSSACGMPQMKIARSDLTSVQQPQPAQTEIPVLQPEQALPEIRNLPSGGWGSPFHWKTEIFVCDLGLNSSRRDVLMEDGRSLAVHLLCQQLQDSEHETCLLNTGVEGRKIRIDHETQEKARCYVRVSCGTVKSKCSHKARYAYVPVPSGGRYCPENADVPIFRLVSNTDNHSCCKSNASLEFSSSKPGKQKWSELQVEKAIWCSELGMRFEEIVEDFGIPRDDACFTGRVAHLMARVRKSLQLKRSNEYSNLMEYLDSQIKTGHTAYYAKMDMGNSVDGQKISRLFWIRAPELFFLKHGLANATSIDFVYKLSQGVKGAFGHLCVLGPEKKIIPVAQFLVESENADAINWIVQHFRQVHEDFQIKYQPSVRHC